MRFRRPDNVKNGCCLDEKYPRRQKTSDIQLARARMQTIETYR